MTNEERYETIDLPFYREKVAPVVPAQILDFHTHIWRKEDWKEVGWETGRPGTKYVVSTTRYDIDDLLADGKRMFPDRDYRAVCFGNPTVSADFVKTNAYTGSVREDQGLYPLFIAGRETSTPGELRKAVAEDGFYGWKVAICWEGNEYEGIGVEDMIGPEELAVANEYGLIVLFHVPTSERLADPGVQAGIRKYALEYPQAKFVIAHCGRCYTPDRMTAAIKSVEDLENVYMDTAMVMEPLALEMVFEHLGPRRVLFASDLPIANMRGRRVYVMDHWVDLVLEGYPESSFRVGSDNMRATYMMWEIVLAVKRAADMAGISAEELSRVYFDNGMELLETVKKE